jgi:hypothetical protein
MVSSVPQPPQIVLAKRNDRRRDKRQPRPTPSAPAGDDLSRSESMRSQPAPAKPGRSKSSSAGPGASRPPRHATQVTLRRHSSGNWELVHPRCAIEREDDLNEVEAMIAAGEQEIARDELRWLLEDCSDNIAAHELLGELALQEEDVALARGHFGYAYQIGVKAIRRAGSPTPLRFEDAANQAFFSAAKGLIHCLIRLEKREMAAEVVELLVHCDPRDPLNVRSLLSG